MKNVKRLLSIVLSLAMLLTMVSFPAFAADYTHDPNTILLEASDRTIYANPATGNTGSGPRFIRRPVNDVYVGDSFAIPEGGIKLPFETDYTGFKLSWGRSGTKDNPHYYDADDHAVYVKIVQKDDGAYITGMYSTFEEMIEGKPDTLVASRKFDAPGTVVFAIHTYYNSEYDEVIHPQRGMGDTNSGFNPTLFSLQVKEAPTTKDYQAVAPEKLPGLAEASTKLKLQRHSYYNTPPEGNLAWVERFTYTDRFNINPDFSSNHMYELNRWPHDGSAADNSATTTMSAARPCVNGYGFEFASKTYVKDFKVNISTSHGWIVYDLYGSMNGETWYNISEDIKSTATSNTHTIPVDAVVRYLRLDLRDAAGSYNTEAIHEITEINGVENVPDGWTVIFNDGTTSATLETDNNGKVDPSELPEQFPASEYSYYVDEVEVTDDILAGTYVFTSNKTVTVTYDYVPKDIVLEASMNSYRHFAGQTIINRPSNHNIFKGDRLVLPEGGLALKAKPSDLPTVNKAPTGIILNVYQKFNLKGSLADGKEQFYLAIDYTKSEYGTITGIYPTMADMVAGKNEMDGIVFEKTGLYVFGIAYGIYHDENTEAAEYQWSSQAWYDNANNNGNGTLFTLTVKEAPEVKDYEISAPAKLPGLAGNAKAINVAATFVADPKSEDFVATNNLLYITRVMTRGSTNNNIPDLEKRPLVYDGDSSDGTHNYILAYTESVNFDFAKKAYIKDMVIKMEPNAIVTDVYGSLDGKDWYVISQRVLSSDTVSHTINVDAVVKYLRVDFVDTKECGGNWDLQGGINITSLNGILDVPDRWTVTFKYDTETEEEVKTDDKGFYPVPEKFKDDFEYYADANYTKKLNTAIPAKGDMTVYVKAKTWTYTPKTVTLQPKKVDSGLDWGNYYNGPIVAPREVIYVGDTVEFHLDDFDSVPGVTVNTTAGKVLYPVHKISMNVHRYAMTETDTAESFLGTYGTTGTDFSFVVTNPGVYQINVSNVHYYDEDGTEVNYAFSNGEYGGVFEVLPKPTSAPKASSAPVYTGAAGPVEALLDTANGTDITNTSIAFKKSYGRNPAYAVGGEKVSVLPINTAMGHPNDKYSTHPTSQTLYLQFNLEYLSYVDNIVVSGSAIYDYDTYGSTDGTNWYLLNSGIVSSNTFNVKGVAKYVRIVSRGTTGWDAQVTSYSVNGYEINENDTKEDTTTGWMKDGVKEIVDNASEFPVAYSTPTANYAITGWKVSTSNGLVEVPVIDVMNGKYEGTLVPVVAEIPVAASALTATLTAKGLDAGKTFKAPKFINGFYVQGAQIRVPSGEGELAGESDLRFVNLLDNELFKKLNELKNEDTVDSFEFGTVVVADTQYTGGDLVIGYTQENGKIAKAVKGEKLFAHASDFDYAYFKYTVCVTKIDEDNYATNVIVRPYITINNADGTSVTLYGEQYDASVYSAAKFALEKDQNLTEKETTYLQYIVDVVEQRN